MFAGALALIIGALAAGSEYGWGTLKTCSRSGRGAPRSRGQAARDRDDRARPVLGAFAANTLWSWVIATTEGRPADWPPVLELVRGVGAGWLILGTWGLLGALSDRAPQHVARGRPRSGVVACGREPRARLRRPGRASSMRCSAACQARTRDPWSPRSGRRPWIDPGGTPGVTAVVSGTQAAVVLLAYVVGAALLAALTLQRQDIR